MFPGNTLSHFRLPCDVETFHSVTVDSLQMVSLGGVLMLDLGC